MVIITNDEISRADLSQLRLSLLQSETSASEERNFRIAADGKREEALQERESFAARLEEVEGALREARGEIEAREATHASAMEGLRSQAEDASREHTHESEKALQEAGEARREADAFARGVLEEEREERRKVEASAALVEEARDEACDHALALEAKLTACIQKATHAQLQADKALHERQVAGS